MLAAWLRDTLPVSIIDDLLDVGSSRIQESVAEWRPGLGLDQEQQSMLAWWARQLARDPELDAIFRALTRKAGYRDYINLPSKLP